MHSGAGLRLGYKDTQSEPFTNKMPRPWQTQWRGSSCQPCCGSGFLVSSRALRALRALCFHSDPSPRANLFNTYGPFSLLKQCRNNLSWSIQIQNRESECAISASEAACESRRQTEIQGLARDYGIPHKRLHCVDISATSVTKGLL